MNHFWRQHSRMLVHLFMEIMLVSWLPLAGSLVFLWLLTGGEITGLTDKGGNAPPLSLA
ncbi:MAG: hypothetical protein GY696_24390 [Gammaproteobacteria bacterium]|nr:hypothetical protein [Gammaproteobacteria bacterium]